MWLDERRTCAQRGCSREFIPKSSRHRYAWFTGRTKPRNPLHDVRHGRAHRQLRAVLASRVRAGLAVCARCGEPIEPNEPWDLGHLDDGGPRSSGRSTLVAIGRRIEDLVREHAATGTHWRS